MKELNIAMKEFYIAVRSKRFIGLLLFYIILLVLMNYAQKDEIINLAGQIRVTRFDALGGEGTVVFTAVSLSIFSNLMSLSIFGALIGITLGADAINREIEEGTVKVLMSHPIYRDQVINGKFLGNGLALLLMIIIGYTITMSFLLLIGVPLDQESVIRAFLASFYTLIYMLTFLSLGIMISSIIKKPETSMLLAIILAIMLTIVYPVISTVISNKIAGDEPYCPPKIERIETPTGIQEVRMMNYECPAYVEWKNKREIWQKRLNLLTPTSHYSQLIASAFAGDELAQDYLPISEAIPLAFNNLAILLVQLLLPFSIAYMRFMTSDLT